MLLSEKSTILWPKMLRGRPWRPCWKFLNKHKNMECTRKQTQLFDPVSCSSSSGSDFEQTTFHVSMETLDGSNIGCMHSMNSTFVSYLKQNIFKPLIIYIENLLFYDLLKGSNISPKLWIIQHELHAIILEENIKYISY